MSDEAKHAVHENTDLRVAGMRDETKCAAPLSVLRSAYS